MNYNETNISVKCLQINLMRKKAATNHLLKYIEDNNIDIILS